MAITDIDGILRGKYLNKDKFLSSMSDGFGFCSVVFGWDSADVCYDNSRVTGWHTGYPDAHVQIDPATFRQIPWENGVPFFLGDVDPKTPIGAVCPRQLLKRVVDMSQKAGYQASYGFEFEWFNFSETPHELRYKNFIEPETITPGMFGYSIIRQSKHQAFFAALMDDLLAFRIPIEGLHTETGPGVLEAAIVYSDILEAADRAVIFKTAVKEIGHRFGIIPSFMARWNDQLPGSGGHMHQSIWDIDREHNVLYAEKKPHCLSEIGKHFIAGQLKLLPELMPMFAPNVNSYKRLIDGYWAPTRAAWGVDNRTVALRYIMGGKKSTRIECRVPGADMNPYLAAAAALASGIYGIIHKLPLNEDPVKGSAYVESQAPHFPRTLQEAVDKMADSKVAVELFGKEFVEHFLNSRLWECRRFQEIVTSYERERYLEII